MTSIRAIETTSEPSAAFDAERAENAEASRHPARSWASDATIVFSHCTPGKAAIPAIRCRHGQAKSVAVTEKLLPCPAPIRRFCVSAFSALSALK